MVSDSPADYQPGQNLYCRIIAAEPGGYAVKLLPSMIDGFLPCQEMLPIDQEVPATFICMNNNRALLSFAYMLGTTARVQAGLTSAPETAFAVWADSHPFRLRLRRATDLLIPPFGNNAEENFAAGDSCLEKLIEDIEGKESTGCVKAFSEENLSRSAALIYKGRAVGCIYGQRHMSEPWPTETALELMLDDMRLPETKVLKYALPEEVILSMSSLFLGYPIERTDTLNASDYLSYILKWVKQRQQTACLIISEPSVPALCLSFIHKGNFFGAFHVEEQKFSPDMAFVQDFLQQAENPKVEASILPPEMISTSVRFGYALNVAASRP